MPVKVLVKILTGAIIFFMSSETTSLYRKYRPQKWGDVIGQDHIVKVIKGALDLGNISHAYLFAGPRGIGKTSVARIIAKDLDVSPSDLHEIDAASNRGIDDVREIKTSVSSVPFESKYKIYIIDEAHMLTKEAWNAFLKTLEEPPEYVIFILATTEMEKIPETILSRCQIYQFKRPSQKILRELVANISKKEGFTIDASSAELIALLADASFRDAQGILQKVMSYSKNKKISIEEVETVTGAPQNTLINDFVKSVSDKSLEKALGYVHKAASQNVDMKIFMRLVLQKMRFVLLLKFGGGMEEDEVKGELSDDDFKFIKAVSKDPECAIGSEVLSELLLAQEFVSRAYTPELPIELALIKLFNNVCEN